MAIELTNDGLSQFQYDVSRAGDKSSYIDFGLYTTETEQNLSETMFDEFCEQNGVDCLYIPREFVDIDGILGEDRYSKFTGENVFPIRLYALSFANFDPNVYFDKTQISHYDEFKFTLTKKRFAFESEKYLGKVLEPKVGDIFVVQMTGDIMDVDFSDPDSVYYERGIPFVWEFLTTRHNVAGETFQTGIENVDNIVDIDNLDIADPYRVTGDNLRVDIEVNDPDNPIIDPDANCDKYGSL